MHDFSDQTLALFDLDKSLNRELDVLAIRDVWKILSHAHVEKIDLLKHVVKTFDDLKVALFEAFVKLCKLNRVIDHVIDAVAVFDVFEVEQDGQKFSLLRVA